VWGQLGNWPSYHDCSRGENIVLQESRSLENIKVYSEQMVELKSRLSYISNYHNKEKDRFLVEMAALQIRKIIELAAFSLISIHRESYKKFRAKLGADFSSDWNGREIIANLLKLNPDFYFKPIVSFNSQNQIVLQEEVSCYTLKRIGKLYERCGGVLHVTSPWKNCNKIESFHGELPSIIKKLSATFENHVILINHWKEQQSTAIIVSLSGEGGVPHCYLAESSGNFTLANA
jgi:hypothetical protein